MVITGPNTGGKTVTLKTVGLLTLMGQAGLHIPANDRSHLRVYDEVFADIGDEQSIEQSLSTFSSHMTNTVSILKKAGSRTLALFDELGAGTDPTEGAALAIAILDHLHKRHINAMATTHYSELKLYALQEDGVENASCEFDVESLAPTYRLLVGIPGKSNAFAISNASAWMRATLSGTRETRIGTETQSFEATIEKLEQTVTRSNGERRRLILGRPAEERRKPPQLRAELSVRLEKAEIKARRDAQRILDEARETAESVYAELDEMRRHANDEQQADEINRARTELRRRLNEKEASLREQEELPAQQDQKSSRKLQAGDTVRIKAMGVKAEVISVNKDGTVNLKAGIMNVSAREDEVLLLEGEKKKPQKTAPAISAGTRLMHVASEIDLRGMESLEGVLAAERYLDSAAMAKMKTVTIIHGKGTRALREAIQQMLKRNKLVKSYRLGRYGEGETGVTVVELK